MTTLSGIKWTINDTGASHEHWGPTPELDTSGLQTHYLGARDRPRTVIFPDDYRPPHQPDIRLGD